MSELINSGAKGGLRDCGVREQAQKNFHSIGLHAYFPVNRVNREAKETNPMKYRFLFLCFKGPLGKLSCEIPICKIPTEKQCSNRPLKFKADETASRFVYLMTWKWSCK
jgi:hypothetical protein